MKKILAVLLSLLFCSSVLASPVNRLVFFGDSLSDDGNIFRLLKLFPPSPYFYGHFTNGYTWAENVSKYFYDKYYTSEANYAYGGATAVLRDSSTTTLELEQTAYYDETLPEEISKATFFIWIGANDYLHENLEDPNTLTDAVISKIEAGVESLVVHGAKQIIVMNIPDLSMTPYGRKSVFSNRLHMLSDMHNRKLDEMVKNLRNQYPFIQLVDVRGMLDDVLKNPGKYNIDNVMDDCLVDDFGRSHTINLPNVLQGKQNSIVKINGALKSTTLIDAYRLGKGYQLGYVSLCDKPNKYVFWDAVHPSAAAHQILAELVEKQLENGAKVSA